MRQLAQLQQRLVARAGRRDCVHTAKAMQHFSPGFGLLKFHTAQGPVPWPAQRLQHIGEVRHSSRMAADVGTVLQSCKNLLDAPDKIPGHRLVRFEQTQQATQRQCTAREPAQMAVDPRTQVAFGPVAPDKG